MDLDDDSDDEVQEEEDSGLDEGEDSELTGSTSVSRSPLNEDEDTRLTISAQESSPADQDEASHSGRSYFSFDPLSLSHHAVQPTCQKPTQLAKLLDNPSIQSYPQRPELVKLDQVQNLSQVFNDLYGDSVQGPRSSDRLAQVPRRDYRRYHQYGDEEERN